MILQPQRDDRRSSCDTLAASLVFAAAGASQLSLSHPLASACALLHAALLLLSGQHRIWLHAAGFVVATIQVASGRRPFAVLYFSVAARLPRLGCGLDRDCGRRGARLAASISRRRR